jgi:hypothetical protein
MNIPLDNLYHWIDCLAQHPVMLYVFRPHGSKDISNLRVFKKDVSLLAAPIVCHDQEPLDFDFYKFDYDFVRLRKVLSAKGYLDADTDSVIDWYSNISLFSTDFTPSWLSAGVGTVNRSILLHSEQNSNDVTQFARTEFFPVYYWCHAVIARDWYRFAQYDARLLHKQIEKTFLIYCRDWTPLREYRLKFIDLLLDADLLDQCVLSTQHVNNQGVHIADYQIQNSKFQIDTRRLLIIPNNDTLPTASADYDVSDLNKTSISVVLETVFDSTKIHLTEKILRPIACKHPFVLAAGPGALAYLRSYGFQTFGSVFDESYDQEQDSIKRLEKIVMTMQQIKTLTQDDWQEIYSIAEHNQRHFFSDAFMNQVTAELETNLESAIKSWSDNFFSTFWQWRKYARRTKKYKQFPQFKSDAHKLCVQELKKHRLSRLQN